jgi:hypothetical protein
VFTVKEMRALALGLSSQEFLKQLGPFVLIQRPKREEVEKLGIQEELPGATAPRIDMNAVSRGTLSLLFEFDDLLVATLPPMTGGESLSVGRLPDADLVIDHASVSKRHAEVRWLGESNRCILTDLGSTNGTFLNAATMVHGEADLKDGDIVSFGDVQFWFLLTPTLWQRLSTQSGTNKLGSHSG